MSRRDRLRRACDALIAVLTALEKHEKICRRCGGIDLHVGTPHAKHECDLRVVKEVMES
jgi:hypothetical protein